MAVSKIKKIVIFGIKDQEQEIMTELQKMGFLHLIDRKEKQTLKSKDETATLLYKMEVILSDLEKRAKESFFEKMKANYLSPEDFFSSQNHLYESNKNLIEEIWSVFMKTETTESQLKEKDALLKELEPWKTISFSMRELEENHYISTLLGSMPLNFYREAESSIFKESQTDLLSVTKDKAYLSLIVLKKHKEELLHNLKNYEFDLHTPSNPAKNFTQDYEETSRDITGLKLSLKELENKKNCLLQYLPEIRVFYDALLTKKEKLSALEKTIKQPYTFAVYAWCDNKDLPYLERALKELHIADYELIEPEPDESAPILLDNSALASPFEFVTALYSYPKEKEPDPTPFIAPFFALFVATWLTDAGYGLLIALCSFFALKKFKLTEGLEKISKILFIAGILTIPIGFLTGGFFGLQINGPGESFLYKLSPDNPLAVFMLWAQKLNPASPDGMMQFLAIAMGFGYVHILLGFLIRFIYRLKDQNYAPAFFETLPWILILIGSLGLLEFVIPPKELSWLGRLGLITIFTGAAMILFLSSRESKNPIARFFAGLYNLYGITSVFGDILSYARLFAGGLSTGIIAMVVNQLAGDILGKPDFSTFGLALTSIFSILLFIFVLIGGHLFNLMMNLLGGFIHTSRLQFVEFFGKFFEGGGEIFTPFKIKMKYYLIKKQK